MHHQDSGQTAVAERGTNHWDSDTGLDRSILLVDQAALFLHFEETLLRRKGWRFRRATRGDEALALLKAERFDLVIMDCALPDMAGEDVVKRIRANPATADGTPVLIVTARGMRHDVDACIAAGCSGILFKPVSKAALCDRVQELLRVPARRYVRTLVRLQVDALGTGRFLFGHTVNLSASGMLLQTEANMEVGESLDLRFFLPGDTASIATRATVVRCAEVPGAGARAYGLTFEALSPDDLARIDSFVDSRTPGNAVAP